MASMVVVSPAWAGPNINEYTEGVAQKSGYDVQGVTVTSFSQRIGNAIRGVISFLGTIFFALTVYAGYLWMTAQGEEEKVTKAKKILKTSAIGMMIVLGAFSITTFFLNGFGGPVGPMMGAPQQTWGQAFKQRLGL